MTAAYWFGAGFVMLSVGGVILLDGDFSPAAAIVLGVAFVGYSLYQMMQGGSE